jgi:hypothetical protein
MELSIYRDNPVIFQHHPVSAVNTASPFFSRNIRRVSNMECSSSIVFLRITFRIRENYLIYNEEHEVHKGVHCLILTIFVTCSSWFYNIPIGTCFWEPLYDQDFRQRILPQGKLRDTCVPSGSHREIVIFRQGRSIGGGCRRPAIIELKRPFPRRCNR